MRDDIIECLGEDCTNTITPELFETRKLSDNLWDLNTWLGIRIRHGLTASSADWTFCSWHCLSTWAEYWHKDQFEMIDNMRKI